MGDRVFVGFGFGAIQAGLNVYEAYRSGRFKRLVVAEVMQDVVSSVRDAGGRYCVNIAHADRLEHAHVEGVELLNPNHPDEREALKTAIGEAHELATALPSVDFFDKGSASVAVLLAEGLARKVQDAALPDAVVYTCENNNHAAEVLEGLVTGKRPPDEAEALGRRVQFLNTVIGKMSGVVTDERQMAEDNLERMTPDAMRAFLVEAFNRILVTEIKLPRFSRGIEVFVEKPDLLPFEEAKLYGHNATHALLGYLAARRGYAYMSDTSAAPDLVAFAREAFIEESGCGLIARHGGLNDALFTPEGYRAYADDLMTRMLNPYLRDAVDRVIRDPRRKMGWNDRLIGTMRVAMDAGIKPKRYAAGAAAALDMLLAESAGKTPDEMLETLWPAPDDPPGRKAALRESILTARPELDRIAPRSST